MSKWYNQGFKDALDNMPSDPPYQPGNKHYDSYLEGYQDGVEQSQSQSSD